ncbi:hypothetical protein Pnap_4808 (plasmid) [Polaromonas naphthalenivorans CJ2]|uniref:Uncharacterized protein n=1 Tax=Polaromonas naphthalenivorans (strain CJ2) TaxID=365044 RepID=A1VX39_POLNA|nr:hypothetical protein Pnap_4808 [Polaromonas naphthalenivorans CJ2]
MGAAPAAKCSGHWVAAQAGIARQAASRSGACRRAASRTHIASVKGLNANGAALQAQEFDLVGLALSMDMHHHADIAGLQAETRHGANKDDLGVFIEHGWFLAWMGGNGLYICQDWLAARESGRWQLSFLGSLIDPADEGDIVVEFFSRVKPLSFAQGCASGPSDCRLPCPAFPRPCPAPKARS